MAAGSSSIPSSSLRSDRRRQSRIGSSMRGRMLSFPRCSSSNKQIGDCRGRGSVEEELGYSMELIISLILIIALSGGLGFIFGRRSNWSRRRVVVVAALPVPIISWGLGGIILVIVWFDRSGVCDNGDCSAPVMAAAVMAAMGFVALTLGILFSLVGLHFAQPTSTSGVHDTLK